MSNDQDRGLRILDNALWRIARRADCDYLDDEKSRPTPCDCPRCVAIAALDAAKNWRFHGAHHGRIASGAFPREAKMHASWTKLVSGGVGQGGPDQRLSQILNENAQDLVEKTSELARIEKHLGLRLSPAALAKRVGSSERSGEKAWVSRLERWLLRRAVKDVRVSTELKRYAVELARATRAAASVQLGAGPRASLALARMAQALALVSGEEFVNPDHIRDMAVPVLAHRLSLDPQARFSGATAEQVVEEVLRAIPVPS